MPATHTLKLLVGTFPTITKSAFDFGRVLKHLSPVQCAAACEAMKDKLPKIIKSGHCFGQVLEYLSPEQRTAVYEAMKDKLPNIIKYGYCFNYVLEYLSPEQRTAAYEAMKNKLPDIITSSDDFLLVLRHLSPKQRTAIYEAMKNKLPDFITSRVDFARVRRHLTPEQRTAIYEAMKDTDYLPMTKDVDFCEAIVKIHATRRQIISSLETAPEKQANARRHAPLYLKSCFDALKIFHDKPNRSALDKQALLQSINKAKDTYCTEVLSKDRSTLSKTVRLLLMAVTNFVAALTFGIVHYVHYRKTGQVGFFTDTCSASNLKAQHRALEKEHINRLPLENNNKEGSDDQTTNYLRPIPA